MKALSAKQERRLRDFLDENLLAISGAYRKRSQPDAELSTLSKYLERMRQVMALILQIPPAGASASLRTAFLLRLTGDAFNSIPGYPSDPGVLPELIDWLDDLDQAWICVLRSQVWDPVSQDGIDLTVDERMNLSLPAVNQTERTRLRSLIVRGVGSLEDWLGSVNADEGNLEKAFEGLQVQDDLNDLFSRTLEEIGSLDETIITDSSPETESVS